MLRVLRLYLKVAIFQPELREHAPHTTFVLKSCDFQAGAGLRKQAREPRDKFQRPFREQQIRTAPQRERFGTRDPRSRSRAHAKNRKKSPVFEPRPRMLKIVKSPQFLTRISAEGRAQPAEIVKSPQFFNIDHADLCRGSESRAMIKLPPRRFRNLN